MNKQDNTGVTPLMEALMSNNVYAVKLLLCKPINFDLVDKLGRSTDNYIHQEYRGSIAPKVVHQSTKQYYMEKRGHVRRQ